MQEELSEMYLPYVEKPMKYDQPSDSPDGEGKAANLDNDSGDISAKGDKSETENLSQEELSKMYLPYVENPMKYDQPSDSPDGEGQVANLDNDSSDISAKEGKSETEMPSQEELLTRYSGRARKQIKYGQRARPDVNLPEEPLRNLSKIPTKQVLTHVLERTNEKFNERYGNILSRIGMLSVQETLQDAFTPATRSLFSVLESGSIGLDE